MWEMKTSPISVFLDADGKILFTYPDVSLEPGDTVVFQETKLIIKRKCLNIDAKCIEYTVQ